MKIGIIGGGASGLFAAISAKNDSNVVTIFEKEKRVGRKILATGNGRCNMTNINACEKNYHSGDINFIKGCIKRFWVNETLEFFTEIGILWKEEDGGKVYPYSDTASSVLDVLRKKADSVGVNTICDFKVEKIRRHGSGFDVCNSSGDKYYCDKIIIATGGKAGSSLGSDGSGYKLLESFGHSITPITPSLVQLKTETDFVKKLKGIKVNAEVKIGDMTSCGELLFTEYGLSGPTIFFLSAYLYNNEYVYIDFMPEYSRDDVYEILCRRCGYLYDTALEEFFTGMLNKRVGQAILKYSGIERLSMLASQLTENDINKITDSIKGLRIKVKDTASWNSAQVTKGGACVSEFNPITMQSKLVKGLFACGEILDIDGDCGGFNLQWAWSSGYLAGKNAAKGV